MTLDDWSHGHQPAADRLEQPDDFKPLIPYEERWLDAMSKGDPVKKSILRGLPLTQVALYGMRPFNPPNGNKGKPYADRNFKETK
jgi:hypothetical protein